MGSSITADPQEFVTLLDPVGGPVPLESQRLLYNPLTKAFLQGLALESCHFHPNLSLSVLPFSAICCPLPHSQRLPSFSFHTQFALVTLNWIHSSMLCCCLIPCKHHLASQACSGPQWEQPEFLMQLPRLISGLCHSKRAPILELLFSHSN